MAADSGNQDGKHIAHQIGNMLLYMLEEKNSKLQEKKRDVFNYLQCMDLIWLLIHTNPLYKIMTQTNLNTC